MSHFLILIVLFLSTVTFLLIAFIYFNLFLSHTVSWLISYCLFHLIFFCLFLLFLIGFIYFTASFNYSSQTLLGLFLMFPDSLFPDLSHCCLRICQICRTYLLNLFYLIIQVIHFQTHCFQMCHTVVT